ncbi:MAG: exodeoxyribonuclease VII small subunit [Bdellovibrionales bacterium]|nr:exodeoxyribonuclease VII small subunit [Bdellovibrionales bacterium]
MKKTVNFESNMKELESIVEKMSQNTLSLEQSIELFEKGMSLSKSCSKELTQAQQKIQKIINSNTDEDLKLEDFSVPDDS